MKRIENVENKNKEQLKMMKDQGINQIKTIKNYGIEKNGLGKVIFLKGILLNIMDNYETNFSKKGQNTL